MADHAEEINALLTEIRDLLRSIEGATSRTEAGITRLLPAGRELFARLAANPRVRKILQQ